MREPSDEQLVASFRQSGEMRHANGLVQRHIGRVRAMIYAMVLNDADADDLTQEVFLRAIDGLGRFRQSARFSTWLFRIAMNTTRTFLGRRAKAKVDSAAELPDLPDGSADPAAAVIAQETDRRVTAALASLPMALRAAITLTALQGLDARAAAAVEGCLTATMYWRVHQARRLLKKKLKDLM
jgi:RNA polymerase sigma-70 factor (ECF subfamily)